MSPADIFGLVVALAVLAWVLLIRTFWSRRLVDRFLGLA